jgi:hypothetical protein
MWFFACLVLRRSRAGSHQAGETQVTRFRARFRTKIAVAGAAMQPLL